MKSVLADTTALHFHLLPFKQIWRRPSGIKVWCFDEGNTSDAFLEAHAKLQNQPNEPRCDLKKVVLGLMFSSDATHLANFRTAKAWPLYLYFANESKYFHAKTGSGALHHVAYIPSVSVCFSLKIANSYQWLLPASRSHQGCHIYG
jgi:hypothetical protein